jgi:hypothetical protein
VGITRQAIIVGVSALIMCLPMTAIAPDNAMASARMTGATNSACAPSVVNGAIPSWASAGFTPSNYRMHYELGHAHAIVALLWKFPLLSPPAKNVANKILWVSHLPTNGSALVISAQRIVRSQPVGSIVHRSVVGGPGPSTIDLPNSGCWHLSLRWSGHTDSLDLQYVAPSIAQSS